MARTRHQVPEEPLALRALPAAALRAVWREGCGAAELRANVLAGLVVGVVALPLNADEALAAARMPVDALSAPAAAASVPPAA